VSLKSTLSDLVRDQTNFGIIKRSRLWLVLSATAVAISIVAFAVRDLNFNIDFEGGTSWQVEVASGDASTSGVRSVVEEAGVDDATVKILGGGDEALVESREVNPERSRAVAEGLAEYAEVDIGRVSISEVGPTWGDEISDKAIRALIFFFVIIAVYLALRFEWKMSVSTLAALVHDLIITVGVYALFQIEVSPSSVVALLTILGYSLYDTVVVFDKIKENTANLASSRMSYSDNVNRSLNEVLLRSINTSLSALIPVTSLLVVGSVIFGALAIRDFAMALFVGLLSGTYSSIFVAAPLLAWWKEKEPTSRRLRERLARQATSPSAVTAGGPAPAAASAASAASAGAAATAAGAGASAAADPDAAEGDRERPAAPAVDPLVVPRDRPIGPRPARPRGKKRRR
jgi:preprotein translocase subunit SecF